MKKVIYLTALRNMAGIRAYEGKRGGIEKVQFRKGHVPKSTVQYFSFCSLFELGRFSISLRLL